MAAPNGQMTAQQLIDVVVQLQQGAQDSQQREAALRQQLENVMKAGQEAQQREQQVRTQVETLTQQLQQQQQQMQQPTNLENLIGAAFNNLAQSQQQLMDTMRTEGSKSKVTLFDTKGLARPDKFEGKEESFLHWRTKLESFVTSVYPEFEQVLTWAEEEENEIDAAMVLAAWGPINPTVKTIEGIESMCSQLHAILQSLCEQEPFSIVRSAGRGNGAEAWRKLVRRYDPSTGNRRRSMLRHVLNPQRVQKIEDLSHSIEKWEEALRLYEGRKRADGTRHVLDDEIKSSVLESMCPSDLEKHLQLNRARYSSYDDVKQEIILYLESRLGSRMKLDPNAMDIGGFGKEGGKGKGKKGKGGKKGSSKGKSGKGGSQPSGKGKGPGNGSTAKETRACHNCGKTGHLQKDCWKAGGGAANKNQQSKGNNNSNKNAKKDSGKKGGKGVSNLEQQQEPEAEAAETGFLSIAGLDEVRSEEPGSSKDVVTVAVESNAEFEDFEKGDFTMVKTEALPCGDPCGCCMTNQCNLTDEVTHYEHRCNACDEARQKALEEASKEGASKTAIRNDTKWRLPEAFHYIVDKTICLSKGISFHVFNAMSEEKKNQLRGIFDPLNTSRDNNPGTLQQIEHERNNMRVSYFENLSEALIEGASRTFRSDPSPGLGELSQPSGSAELPSRQVGATSSNAMHRTIEILEISKLDEEKRAKYQELEEVETEEGRKQIEARIEEIDKRKTALKEQIRENDRKAKQTSFKLTEDNLLDQSWHDARYYAALKGGASHSQAWTQEKKRRRATLFRKQGMPERTAEKLRLDAEWHAEFDSKKVKDEEFQDEHSGISGIETEAIVEKDDKIQVLSGGAKEVKRGKLRKRDQGTFMKSVRKYRALTQDEVQKFTQETKEDEKKVMKKSRVNIFKKRYRPMGADKKKKRKFRVKQARKLGRMKAKEAEPGKLCSSFTRSFCRSGAKCKMVHSEVSREIGFIKERKRLVERSVKNIKLTSVKESKDLGSFEAYQVDDWSKGKWSKVTVNFDTGAAVTAVPMKLARDGLVVSDKTSSSTTYKTASGELLPDEGGTLVKGYDNEGRGRSVQGRLVNVHRMLVSGAAVTKRNMVILDGDSGTIIPKTGIIAEKMAEHLEQLKKQYPKEHAKCTEMYVDKGIYVFDMWLNGADETIDSGSNEGNLGAVDAGFPRQAHKP